MPNLAYKNRYNIAITFMMVILYKYPAKILLDILSLSEYYYYYCGLHACLTYTLIKFANNEYHKLKLVSYFCIFSYAVLISYLCITHSGDIAESFMMVTMLCLIDIPVSTCGTVIESGITALLSGTADSSGTGGSSGIGSTASGAGGGGQPPANGAGRGGQPPAARPAHYGGLQVDDPNNSEGRGYITPTGNETPNQPYSTNLADAMQDHYNATRTTSNLSRYVLAPGQQGFMLGLLRVNNPELYNRVMPVGHTGNPQWWNLYNNNTLRDILRRAR